MSLFTKKEEERMVHGYTHVSNMFSTVGFDNCKAKFTSKEINIGKKYFFSLK